MSGARADRSGPGQARPLARADRSGPGRARPLAHFVERDGLRLHVLSFGAGPDLLLIPGITSPAPLWDFVAEPLGADFAVHVLDLRGRGRSGTPADGGYELGDYAADAAAAIETLELTRPALVGHSLGGRIAAALALRRPELVGPVVVVDPPLSRPGRAAYPLPLEFYLDAIRDARAGRGQERVRASHPNWSPERLAARAEWLGSCDEEAVAESWRNFHAEDFHALWHSLPAPVLITGEGSDVVTPEGRRELLELNPRARSIVVEGAGHMVPWDQPERFEAAVRQALARRTAGVA